MASGSLSAFVRHLRLLVARQDSKGLSDRELLRRFTAQRDEAAFAVLVARHGPLVLAVGRRVLHDVHAAEDVFQATFLVLARKAASIRKHESIASWLYGVAYRLAVRAKSQAAKRQLHERQVKSCESPGPVAEVAWRELGAVLDEELNRLPEKHRAPLLLCYLEGKTQDEAAEQLGWTRSTFRNRLERGRELLRGRLERRGVLLSTGLLASALSQSAASAMVSTSLLDATIEGALAFGMGEATAAGFSAHAVVLAKGALHAMVLTKIKVATVVLMSVGLLGVGSRVVMKGALAGRQAAVEEVEPEKPAARRGEQRAESREPNAAKTDRYGDPLPEGAVARMGTVRRRHADAVTCFAFLPDGKRFLSGSHDSTLRLWDVATGKELRRFLGHRGIIRQLAISSDGMLCASWEEAGGEPPGLIHVWDVDTGKEIRQIVGPKEGIGHLAWSADNQLLAVGGKDGSVCLVALETGREIQKLAWHKVSVRRLAFSPDGTQLASCVMDGTICVGNTDGNGELLRLRGREKQSHFLSFSADGKTLITGGDCYGDNIGSKTPSVNTIGLWDLTTGQRQREFRVGDDRDRIQDTADGSASVALSADGKMLALGYWDHTIRLWDMASGKSIRRVMGYKDQVFPAYQLAFSPDGKVLGATGSFHAVAFFDVATGKQLNQDAPAHDSNIRAVALSTDGKLLATASHDQRVVLWDSASGEALHELNGHESWVYTVAFAPSGRTVASGATDGTVRVWDTISGKELKKLTIGPIQPDSRGGKVIVTRVVFSPDGNMLAANYHQSLGLGGKGESGIVIWEAAAGRDLRRLPGPSADYGSLAFTPDGKTILAAGDDRVIRRMESATGKELSRFTVQGHQSLDVVVFSSDGALAATGGYDGRVFIWDMSTGRQLLAIRKDGESHQQLVGIGHRLIFSPDGRCLALCGASFGRADKADDLAVELWELASGQVVLSRRLPRRTGVSSVAFSADGQRLATGMGDTTALIWDMTAPASEKSAQQLENFWSALAGEDAARAWQAMAKMAAFPEETAAFLKGRLRPAKIDREQILKLVADLGHDQFAVREKSYRELEQLGPDAQVVFRESLANAPTFEVRKRLETLEGRSPMPVRSPEMRRVVRAVALLEQIDSPDARRVLESLFTGAPEARLTQEAKASLDRLAKRSANAMQSIHQK